MSTHPSCPRRSPRPPRLLRRALPVGAAAVALLAAPPAGATGFLTDQFGNDMGQSGLSNAYSVYFNPAAMTGSVGSNLVVDGVIAARTETFNRSTSALSPVTPSQLNDPAYRAVNTGQASLFNVLGAPYLGFVTDLGTPNFRFGAAVYAPFGATVNWAKSPGYSGYPGAPGAIDGTQRWSDISLSLASIYETVAAAYRFPDLHLGVGVSLSVIETQLLDSFAHNLDGSDSIIENSRIGEGRAFVNVSGVEVGAAAGVYWEPTPKLRLGASYTSAPNFGTMRLSGTFQEYQLGSTLSSKGDLLQAFPDVVRAGGAWRVTPDTEVRLDVAWQRWSNFKSQCFVDPGASCNIAPNGAPAAGTNSSTILVNLQRNFQDSVRVRLGGAYWVEPQTELYGSAGVESSPVAPKNEDPLTFDSVHVQGTLGVKHQFSRHVYASLAYTLVYYLPVTVTNSALNTYSQPSKQPSENGNYNSSLYIFDGAVGYLF